MRDNFKNKISVLNKMIGLGGEVSVNPFYTVPQNSTTDIDQTKDLYQPQEPLENTTKNFKQTICKCPHCENMAKNFLYLESLIRTNYNVSNNCNICQSSLQYLQYVNKSIMKIFGNFDSVAEAAKAFGLNNIKSKTKLAKLRTRHAKRLTTSNHLSLKKEKVAVTANHIKKMPSNVLKSSGKRMQGGLSKNPIGSSKKSNKKKSKFKKDSSSHSAVKSSIALDGATIKSPKGKKIKSLRSKTRNLLNKFKTKK